MKTLGLALILAGLLSGGCASLKDPAVLQMGVTQQSVYADQAVKIIHMIEAPGNGTVVIACKKGDKGARVFERAVQTKLRAAGYAVQLALPDDERQEGDKGVFGVPNLNVELIPYEGAPYTELAVTLRGERFSRLFSAAGSVPSPVSNWVKRERQGAE